MAIVKVQKPMITNDPDTPWLVYDRHRHHVRNVPDAAIPAAVKRSMGNDLKGYYDASFHAIDGWSFLKRVPDQDW